MKDENLVEQLGMTFEYAKSFIETKIEILQVKLIKKIVLASSGLAIAGLAILFVFTGSIFLLIAAAIALGNYFESAALGFLGIGGLLFLVMLIVFLFRKQFIINPFTNYMVKMLFDENEEN